MDLSFLDSGLIPSLGKTRGGSVGNVDHQALMGRSIPASLQGQIPLLIFPDQERDNDASKPRPVSCEDELTPRPLPRPAATVKQSTGRVGSGGPSVLEKMRNMAAVRPPVRPPLRQRRSSMTARISATITKSAPTANPNSQSLRRLPQIPHHVSSSSTAPEVGQILSLPLSIERQTIIPNRRVSPSHLSPPPRTARHARSISWSAPRNSCIRLTYSPNSDPIKLLVNLQNLIPPTRLDPLTSPPSSSTLHPPTLLAGLAFILEALVSERQNLTSSSPPNPLPMLRDNSSLQLQSLELDWAAMRTYLESFGTVLEGLSGILMNSEMSESILGLIEMIKTYVDKQRKVFGEVAGIYMDHYSFMAGWWDEEGMRGSASEIGRWGEMIMRA